MKKVLLVAASMALVLSGCTSGGNADPGSVVTDSAGAPQGDDAGSNGGGEGGDLCSDEPSDASVALALTLQGLAQVSADVINGKRHGETIYDSILDTEGAAAGIEELRPLDGHPAPGYEDPKVTLDHWEDLNNRVAAMLQGDADVTDADIAAYNEVMVSPQDLIGSQLGVYIAKDNFCAS